MGCSPSTLCSANCRGGFQGTGHDHHDAIIPLTTGRPRQQYSFGDEAREQATLVAQMIIPFVPRRIVEKYLQDHLDRDPLLHEEHTTLARISAEGRFLQSSVIEGSILVIDVSGFTRLSQFYSTKGSAGAEHFSLSISEFLARLTNLIVSFGGDVDAFAGDAALVVFASTNGPAGVPQTARQAVMCALRVYSELHGYRHSPEEPELYIHAALASGQLASFECGGQLTSRAESFLVGPPMAELGSALDHSRISEMVLSPSSWTHVSRLLTGKVLEDQNVRVLLSDTTAIDARLINEAQTGGASKVQRDPQDSQLQTLPSGIRRFHDDWSTRGGTGSHAALARRVARKMELQHILNQSSSATKGFRTASAFDVQNGFPNDRSESHTAGGPPGVAALLGPLLQFVPAFVRERCISGCHMDMLAEHRHVSVLFFIGKPQEINKNLTDTEEFLKLKAVLTQMIDIAEGKFGGTTRQITMDDKGLAAIFVFGLPGFLQENHAVCCVTAALNIFSAVMSQSKIRFTAGITTGACFCGLIGDMETRTEYAVMGDIVNTAARLAVHAASTGQQIICSSEASAMSDGLDCGISSQIVMTPVGSVKLKGREGTSPVFTPEVKETKGRMMTIRNSQKLVGRERHLRQLFGAITCGAEAGHCVRCISIHGMAGTGKTALAERAIQMLKECPGKEDSLGDLEILWLQIDKYSSSQFLVCQRILSWLLQLTNAEEADKFSWFLNPRVQECAVESLPSLLRPHGSRILGLKSLLPLDCQREIQSLYGQIFYETLMQRRLCIYLEGAQDADEHIAPVVEKVLSLSRGMNQRGESECGELLGDRVPVSSIVLTHRTLSQAQSQTRSMRGEIMMNSMLSDESTCIYLGKLSHKEVMEVARACLEADGISDDLEDLITSRCGGNPMYVKELCKWLQTRNMVHNNDGVASVLPEALGSLPPSMQRVVLSVMDSLPPGPNMLVRSASVLGLSFPARILMKMLPASVVTDTSTVLDLLQVLQRLGIMKPSTSSGSDAFDSVWEFSQAMYQEVIYGTISHGHRQTLHQQAATLLEEDLRRYSEGTEPLHMLEQLCNQWHQFIATTRLHKAIDSAAFSAAAAAVDRLGDVLSAQLGAHGNFSRMARLHDLFATFDLSETPVAVLEVMCAFSVRYASYLAPSSPIDLVMDNQEFDRVVAAAQQRNKELMEALESATVETEQSGAGRDSVGWKAEVGISMAVAKMLPALRRSGGMVPPSALSGLIDRMNAADTPSKRFLIGAHWMMMAVHSAPPSEICQRTSAILADYRRAGAPRAMKTSFGSYCICQVTLVGYVSELATGQITGGPAHSTIPKELPLLDASGRALYYLHRKSWEHMWEPPHSARVKALEDLISGIRSQTKWIEAHMKPMLISQEAGRNLRLALQQIHGHHPSSLRVSPEPPSPALVDTWEKLIRRALSVAGSPHMFKCDTVALTKVCISAGMGVLFPDCAGLDLPLGPATSVSSLPVTAVRLLQAATGCLCACLEEYEGKHLNVFGELHFMPATSVYARAVLHFFQSVLHASGHQQQLPTEVLPGEGHPLASNAPGQQRPAPGLQGLVLALLLAQRRGFPDELSPSCLPATLLLARLLLGLMQADVGPSAGADQPLLVAPSPTLDTQKRDGSSPLLVTPGTSAAVKVAQCHIEEVTRKFTFNGVPLSIRRVTSAESVDYSETLWEAARLWRHCEDLLSA